jgi:hypothetical protein
VQKKLRLDLREPRVVSPAVSIDLDDVSSGNSGNRSARPARHLAHLALTWGQCTLGQLRLTVVGDFMPVRRRFPEGRFAIRISMRPLREAAPVTPQPSDRGCPYRSRACSWRDMKAAATAALHAPERNTRRKKRYGAELPYHFKAGEFSRQYVSQCRTAAAGSIAGSRPRRGSIRRFAV